MINDSKKPLNVKVQVPNLFKEDQFEPQSKEEGLLEQLQNLFDVKTLKGKIYLEIRKETQDDKTLFSKKVFLDIDTKPRNFRIKSTDPIVYNSIYMYSVEVVLGEQPKVGQSLENQRQKGRVLIVYQVKTRSEDKQIMSEPMALQLVPQFSNPIPDGLRLVPGQVQRTLEFTIALREPYTDNMAAQVLDNQNKWSYPLNN